jgi:hypothetical protein
MDRLTHISITNCAKELDALSTLVLSGEFTTEEIADWIQEISWNLSHVFRRQRYNSDEFQMKLKRLVQARKREQPHSKPEDDNE